MMLKQEQSESTCTVAYRCTLPSVYFTVGSADVQEGAMRASGDQEPVGRQIKKRSTFKKQIFQFGPCCPQKVLLRTIVPGYRSENGVKYSPAHKPVALQLIYTLHARKSDHLLKSEVKNSAYGMPLTAVLHPDAVRILPPNQKKTKQMIWGQIILSPTS